MLPYLWREGATEAQSLVDIQAQVSKSQFAELEGV